MRIPLMFVRRRRCTLTNGLKANCSDGVTFITVVVMLPTFCDESHYNSAWHDNPVMSPTNHDDNDYMTQVGVDTVAKEDTYVFDSDDASRNYRDALIKMKELWVQVDPNL